MEIRQLTFTRFLAALLIIIFHYGLKGDIFGTGMAGHFAKEGAFAVSFFFCLSGYILAHVYYDENSLLNKRQFFVKRLARIYPIYLLGIVVVIISNLIILGEITKGRSIIAQILGLHAWFPGICLEINYPGWSISVEIFFYLMFPLILKLFKGKSSTFVALTALAFWILSNVAHVWLKLTPGDSDWGEFWLFNPFLHLNAFVFGAASCILVKRHRKNVSLSPLITSIAFLIACLCLFFIIATDNPIVPYVHNGLLSPLFVLIILALQFDTGPIAKVFSLGLFVFLGEISYGFYILQHPVRLWFEQVVLKLGLKLTYAQTFCWFVLTLLGVSCLMFVLFERPVRRWINQRWATKA